MVVIRKLRLYLETTVFNYYFDADRDGHEDTVKLFDAIDNGEYEAYTSDYVILEIERAKEPKQGNMLALIEKYAIGTLNYHVEATRLTNIYVQNSIIPARYRLDSSHIAIASVYGLDCVISYNFEHINRPKTKILVGEINSREGYGDIIICTSKEVLDGGIQHV
jgi:predicted nucleic acid-binding protein